MRSASHESSLLWNEFQLCDLSPSVSHVPLYQESGDRVCVTAKCPFLLLLLVALDDMYKVRASPKYVIS